MKPTANNSVRTPQMTLRALLLVALLLLLSLALAGIIEYLRLQERANDQATDVSQAFGNSTAILVQPLVLSDDRISLNYLLNELASLSLISGVRLTAPDQTLIALSGKDQGHQHTLELVQGEVPIGQLTIWSNPTVFSTALQTQLTEILLLLALCFGITLVLMLFGLTRPPRTQATIGSDPAEAMTDTVPMNTPVVSDTPAASTDHEQPATDSDLIPDFSFARNGQPPASAAPKAPAPPDIQATPAQPEDDTDMLPDFPPLQSEPETVSVEVEEEENERDSTPALPPLAETPLDTEPSSELPTTTNRERERAPLYVLEAEPESTLIPEEAGYLFLIDTRSAHSDNLDEQERDQLLHNYRILANSVARIYSGETRTLNNGDLCILFAESDDKDTHGINALCCAMLFAGLYKQYNQKQIRAFQPVINLHMALVRGAREQMNTLLEQAQRLTQTTQSNELISHAPLTDADALHEVLLQDGRIRHEDEDKVLIMEICATYQELLDKQAQHLLNKLDERDQGQAD
ncbi:hypothetical protein [Marinobacterium marinum]|uniref:Histidine kinase n=1 Tax=Marinobacterium marinum TaxID=2756129 RepID=A0A7W1X0B1_9GAMM|nr:hypothetical protein [Marinobacterium marinum]MBA4503437.1 hypothetical protein [Marinobacterium marinum]